MGAVSASCPSCSEHVQAGSATHVHVYMYILLSHHHTSCVLRWLCVHQFWFVSRGVMLPCAALRMTPDSLSPIQGSQLDTLSKCRGHAHSHLHNQFSHDHLCTLKRLESLLILLAFSLCTNCLRRSVGILAEGVAHFVTLFGRDKGCCMTRNAVTCPAYILCILLCCLCCVK